MTPASHPRRRFLGITRGCQDIIGTLIFGGVFERVPELRVVFANSQRVLAEQTAHLPVSVRDDIVWRNCARLYNLDVVGSSA